MLLLSDLRRLAVSQTLFAPSTLENAFETLGFVQADPIRAPARAQDLILRPRVQGYQAGMLEANYPKLKVDEDYFVNYGFLQQSLRSLFHPRVRSQALKIELDTPELLPQVLEFVQANGASHPKVLETHFGKTRVGNAWGGSSNATTRALEGLHYKGLLRVAAREKGIKVYEAVNHNHAPLKPEARAKGVLELILRNYAPLPLSSLLQLCSFSGLGAPSLKPVTRKLAQNLETVLVDGIKWVLPLLLPDFEPPQTVTLLAPFDPIVWDRRRFLLLHGWEYRFEAYTKPEKRIRGYYALPMLYGTDVIGWANIGTKNGFEVDLGYVRQPKSAAFKRELRAELERMEFFLTYLP
jgi:uncharacterized protein